MRAYAIFAGGGVKGAALAGCLMAAQDRGIEFLGYGGTSAGSMVALLAAVGYTGSELRTILVDQTNFAALLDDGGRSVQVTLELAEQILRGFQSHLLRKLFAIGLLAPKLIKRFSPSLGLYEGNALRRYLLQKIIDKHPRLATHADVSFEDLAAAGCKPLKIVASDVTRRTSAVFARDRPEYGTSVIEAVRASTSYPFVFQPVEKNGRRLVDGGLSSNLPAFLFESEYRASRVPAFAFDLLAPESAPPSVYDAVHFVRDLSTTALEASDDLLRGVLRGVVYVPVRVPPGIKTLDFGLKQADRMRLFDAGYQATGEFLAQLPALQRLTAAGDRLQYQLCVEYGDPKYFVPILWAVAQWIVLSSSARHVRAHIMLPTGRQSRMVVYHYGMGSDGDADLEIGEAAGCSGRAWIERAAAVADLQLAARNPEAWGMTAAQHAKVPAERKSMLSVPIHAKLRQGEQNPPPPLGTLSVDTTTALEETGWVERVDGNLTVRNDVVSIMMGWAYIVHRVLSQR